MLKRIAILFLWLGAVSCSNGDTDGGNDASISGTDATIGGDGGTADGSSMGPAVILGTGQDEFRTLQDGDTVSLEQGPQGGGRFEGHHVVASARLVGAMPSEFDLITFTVTSSAGTHATLSRVPGQSAFVPDGMGGMMLLNIQLRVDDCCAVANHDFTIGVELTGGPVPLSDLRSVHGSNCPAIGANLCN